MNLLALIIVGILAILVLIQIFPTAKFVSLFYSPNQQNIENDQLPKAAVVLSLRGADPFLADCIHGLLNQNYPEYKVHIVVDSQEDPAWKIVNDTICQSQATHIQVSPLVLRHSTCSLKNSALVQAIQELDDSYKVVAIIDADVVPHSDWLRELVAPLADEEIGVTTGNRWYVPHGSQWGSLVRSVWNSAGVVSMYVYNAAWGGSMAIKLSVLHQAQLLEKWTQALSTDALIGKALKELGLKLKFVPTVMIVNREECQLSGCLRFMTRQLLTTRLYHPCWILSMIHALITTLPLVLAIVLLPYSLLQGDFNAAALFASGFVGYILTMGLLLTILEQSVQQVVRGYDETTRYFSFQFIAKFLLAIPLAQIVSTVATVLAILKQKFEWRGVVYQIKAPYNIRLIEYHPYQISLQLIDRKASII
ncbi:glycosyltransferase [Chlorogloeopsis fritschii PCC 9212]|uniref:Ceramide glucosyltransferase n=1 Tax=Chlorogloeopsis fritschii PCC 6912 TaxID=211165 RepID=A0A3S0Y749_CHLFR|nr:glycosyltransferase family 2 protein [Chlorogloeopsis fritschii]MBF2005753.1 glycosyltransferase family 2 protein [Chlorogloeopsis fritschii C42_A2020_084]RUR85865.1 ceramide glucosyltransferase [Chlorogloeopsis fritschii PCC 6912]